MKLKHLLIELLEGTCERLPGESDEDFLTRCGNDGFDQMDRLKVAQLNLGWSRNVMKETPNTQPSSKMRPEPHPTRHETEHPSDEDTAFPHVKAVKDWQKKNRLKEVGLPQNAGIGSPLIKLVFWDDKKGLNDPRKIKEILRVLERNLKIIRPTYNISLSDIMNSFKYFSATDKLIGNYPKYLFFDEKARRGPNRSVTMRNCRFNDELEKISKSLEVKQKTV